MSLTYLESEHPAPGKTSSDTDTFEGTFAELVPDERLVEMIEFDSPDPLYAGQLMITTSLSDAEPGSGLGDVATIVTVRCEGIPPGVALHDNETGTAQSLAKLARLLE
jgi:hypothetical protein